MKAVGIVLGTTKLELLELEPPQITAPDEVLIKVEKVGICSTDRAIARGEIVQARPGASHLVLGHEMLGRVVEVGAEVNSLNRGDLVVPTVRRGCGECISCLNGESDMCFTGKFTERGISGADGYMTEYVVDKEEYLIPVPPDLEDVAVLVEPLSIAEKAIMQVVSIQRRLRRVCPHPEHAYTEPGWGHCKTAFVAGAGSIGILASFLLRANNVTTYVMATRPSNSFKARLVEAIGAHYISAREIRLEELKKRIENIDIIVEATGVAQLGFELMDILGANGILVFIGTPTGSTEVKLDVDTLIRQQVFLNQVTVGSVNSNHSHFEQAVTDLASFKAGFGNALSRVITHRYSFNDYLAAFTASAPDLIKAVLEIRDA